MVRWRNNYEIRKWFFNRDIINKEQQLKWYEKYLKNDTDIMLMIEEVKNPKEPIGTVGLYNVDRDNKTAEFGRFMIGDFNARGKGYGLESVKAICYFGFHDLGLNNIKLEVIDNNKSAISIYKKSGFEVIGEYYWNNEKVIIMNKAGPDI